MNQLGELIRETRKAKGISQETLGKLVSYERPNILNIEAGKKPAPDDLLERIAQELDLPYKRLLALKILDRIDNEVKDWLRVELSRL